MTKALSPRKATIDVRSVNRAQILSLEGHRTALKGEISIQITKPDEFNYLMQTLKSYNLDVTVTDAHESGQIEQLYGSILSQQRNASKSHINQVPNKNIGQ